MLSYACGRYRQRSTRLPYSFSLRAAAYPRHWTVSRLAAVRLVHHKISEATMATSAPEGEGPPLDAEVMGKFQEMFADLLLEAKEGRLSQEEVIKAATRRMEAHGAAIQASPHCSAAARRLLSVETDECVAVLLKDGLSTGGDPARIPDISEATLAALNAVLSGKPSSPEQRAKWPRGLGDVLDADPVVTAKVLRGPRTRRALGVRPRRGPAPAGAAERVDQPHGPAHQGRHRVQDQVPEWRVRLHVRGGVDAIAATKYAHTYTDPPSDTSPSSPT